MRVLIKDIYNIYKYKTDRKTWENRNMYGIHCLSYQVSGRYDHTFPHDTLPVQTDSLFLIRAGEPYSVKRKEYGESLCITFKADIPFSSSVYSCENNPEIKKLFYSLLKYKNSVKTSDKCLVTAILYEIFAFIYREHEKEYIASDIKGKIAEVYRYMAEHYMNTDFKTATLSGKCGISDKYFRTMFKKIYSITPTQCLIEMRLNAAVDLLKEGNLSVRQIAEEVGFSDIYYFSKMFKQHFKDSPKNFLKQINK